MTKDQEQINNKRRELRSKIIKEIKELWPGHLQDEFVSLGGTVSILDGNFSRNDLKRICVGMTTLQVRLDLLKFLEGADKEKGVSQESDPSD